ncbi:MAG: hypothetical protein ACRDD1_11200, partial [Planctomycetia bacterium]
MSTLGKVLLFANLLFGAGVVYLATDDWSQRQAVTGTALKHRLVLTGLPLDGPPRAGADSEAVPLAMETTGGYVVESVSPKLLASYFEGADGGSSFGASGTPPSTQLEEVKRVWEKVQAVLRDANDTARVSRLCGVYDAKGDFAPGWLVVMAESFEERLVARELARSDDPKAAADKAEAILKRKFDAILNKPAPKAAEEFAEKVKAAAEKLRGNPLDPVAFNDLTAVLADAATPDAARDEGDRRRRVVHILAHLDRDPAWQKRVGMVVGLKSYQHMIADQANRFRALARSTQRQIELDQANFVEQYEQHKNLALERSQLLDQPVKIREQLELRSA